MSGRLDVAVEVKVVLPHREVAAQHPGLRHRKREGHDPRPTLSARTAAAAAATCDLCFSRSFTSRSTSFCLRLVSSCSRFSSSSLLLRSSSRACRRSSISRSCTGHTEQSRSCDHFTTSLMSEKFHFMIGWRSSRNIIIHTNNLGAKKDAITLQKNVTGRQPLRPLTLCLSRLCVTSCFT